MWKQFINDYLTFTKKERTGIFILLFIIFCCLLLPYLFPFFIQRKRYDHSAFQKEMAQLKVIQADTGRQNDYTRYDYRADHYQPKGKSYFGSTNADLFYFDPNTATVNEWVRLGVRQKTAETIQKYISKGGRFYKAEDIARIWGLHPDHVKRLLPFVRIENTNAYGTKVYPKYKESYENVKAIGNIDINASDTTAFISLPGIGNKLAQRIISFRDKLGGFYSIEQVKETYGLPDSTFQIIKTKLVLSNSTVRKININSATVEEMRAHPYLKFNLANAIFQYRSQHGNFVSVADIKRIMIVTDEIFNKVSPYLTAE